MKLKNKQIVVFLNTYEEMKGKKLPVKFGYAVKKIASAWNDAAAAYTAERKEILDRYAKKDKNGKNIVEDNCYVISDQEEYAKEIEELLEIETEAEIQKVSEEIIEKCDDPRYDPLTLEELAALEFMAE